MVLLRHLLGDALRRLRLRQGRTLREVSATARVSLGYLSEVERGRKEASSELLASICDALGAPLSQVLREVSDGFALAELQNEPAFGVPLEPAMAGQGVPEEPEDEELVPADSATSRPASRAGASHPDAVRLPQPARSQQAHSQQAPAKSALSQAPALPQPASQRLVMPQRKLTVRSGQHLSAGEPVLEPVKLPGTENKLARDITDMVPV
jgi:transcriptional regulator with XRE-family HTH domain